MGEMAEYKVGQVVELSNGSRATVRWIGQGEFAPGEWLGLELEEPIGKNNGEVKGKRYFRCADDYGMMVRPESIKAVVKPAPTAASAKATTMAAKRTSMIGIGSNGVKAPVPVANKRMSTVAAPAVRRQTLIDPTSKRQSMNAASPTPAPRSTAPKGLPSPTKQVGGRPASISSAPKPTATASRPSTTSTAVKRTSLGGRPSLAPGGTATRTTRAPSLAASATAPKPVAPSAARRTVAPRLSSLQQQANGRTASISSRTELSEHDSTEQDDDNDQSPADQGIDGTADGTARGSSKAGPALLSPPVSAREPTSPHLSRPTTQQLSSQNRKIDDLETKLRILEKQKTEDKDRLKDLERLSGERDKLEGLIQKLQAKIQPQSQEILQLRKEVKELEERANAAEGAQANIDDAIEEATLDREMAEELAETYKIELDTIRKSHEELKLEVEILRAENEDLGREMSPEERDSMGFAQLEKSNERLRDALIRLRDITQDTEAELRDQIRELQDESTELATVKIKFEESQEQLGHSESLIEELRQQLESAQGAEEMIEELTEKNMALSEQIEDLRSAVEDLESLKEINDELELNHVEHEKAMQEDIDYRDALLFEQARKASEQQEVMEELEYTVTRFRELVSNLTSDLEDMRASQQITEAEANDLSSRSKAMLDLNMRLQQSAAKTQVKVLETELKRLEAQEASDHLAIIQMFLPESYAQHRDSVKAFLRFKRVSFKAAMMHSFMREKVNGLAVPGHEEDMFAACDVLDKLTWIAAMCDRFAKFIVSCPLEVFTDIANASYDLDPVERMFNAFVDRLKRDDLKEQQCAADLQRTISVLEHLGERYLGEGLADYAEAVHMRALVIQSHLETGALAVAHIKSTAQARVVLPSDADETDEEEAQSFLAKADSVVSQIRSAKVIAGKALHQLEELKSRSLTLEPSTEASIEGAQTAVAALAAACRASGLGVARIVNEEARLDSLTFEQVMHAVADADETPFSSLTSTANAITTAVQSFSSLTLTLSQTVEFTGPQTDNLSASSTPWAQLASRLRDESSASAGHEAEIARLQTQLNERSTALAMKDKTVSELNVSVEVLEKRAADATKATNRARELEQNLQQAERKARDLDSRLVRAIEDVRALRIERETWIASGASKAGSHDGGDGATEGVNINVHPDFVPAKAANEISTLRTELEAAQCVVRQLRAATNQANQSAALTDGILESLTPQPKISSHEYEASMLEKSAKDAFKSLRTLVSRENASFVKLQHVDKKERLKWKPFQETVTWQVGKRREEWENWKEWVGIVAKDEETATKRREAVRQARQEKSKMQQAKAGSEPAIARGDILAKLSLKTVGNRGDAKAFNGEITIVNPTEWDGLGGKLGLIY